jgi:hypothetical protein
LPGCPAIIYGDEIGKTNDIEFMKLQTARKQERLRGNGVEDDTRDINRGVLVGEDLKSERAVEIYEKLSRIFTTRLEYSQLAILQPERIAAPTGVFVGKYSLEGGELVVCVNLTYQEKRIELNQLGEVLLEVGSVKIEENAIGLGEYAGVWIFVSK